MPEPVIVVDELNTSGLAQASANSAGAVPQADRVPM